MFRTPIPDSGFALKPPLIDVGPGAIFIAFLVDEQNWYDPLRAQVMRHSQFWPIAAVPSACDYLSFQSVPAAKLVRPFCLAVHLLV